MTDGMIPAALISLTMLSTVTIVSISLFTEGLPTYFLTGLSQLCHKEDSGVYHYPHFIDDEKPKRLTSASQRINFLICKKGITTIVSQGYRKALVKLRPQKGSP